MSIISVAGHQVVKNLSEPSEITLVHLDIYADHLREKDPKLDSRAVRALLTTGGPRLRRVDGHYIELHGPYLILMNVDGINIYTKAHVTDCEYSGLPDIYWSRGAEGATNRTQCHA